MTDQIQMEWASSREWPARCVRWLIRTLNQDLGGQNFSIDFHDKLLERHITLAAIRGAINNPESYIARYWYGDGSRVGIWQSQSRLFIAWKPRRGRSASRFMTAFRKADGVAYMQDFPPFREIRGPTK